MMTRRRGRPWGNEYAIILRRMDVGDTTYARADQAQGWRNALCRLNNGPMMFRSAIEDDRVVIERTR